MLEAVTFGVFSEVQRGMSGGVSGVRGVWNGYVGLRHVQAENDDLKRQLADGADRAAGSSARWPIAPRGLEQLLELRERVNLKTTAAEIIGGAAHAGFPDHDHRQGDARRAARRHGGDRAGGRGRPGRRAERPRARRCSC